MLGKQLSLHDEVWVKLNFGWALGFFFAGALEPRRGLQLLYGILGQLQADRRVCADLPLYPPDHRLPGVQGLSERSRVRRVRISRKTPPRPSAREGTHRELPAFIYSSAWLCCQAPHALSATTATAETAYISDNLTVPLRSGPSNANRILHRGLPSGTRLEILARDSDSGFVQIRTDRGTEGWLPAQYLVDEPIARDRLVAANRRIQELNGDHRAAAPAAVGADQRQRRI